MAKMFIVQNISKRILPINLDTYIGRKRDSLHLLPKEKSRELNETEFKSKEISELLRTKPRASLKVIEIDSMPIAAEKKIDKAVSDKSIVNIKK